MQHLHQHDDDALKDEKKKIIYKINYRKSFQSFIKGMFQSYINKQTEEKKASANIKRKHKRKKKFPACLALSYVIRRENLFPTLNGCCCILATDDDNDDDDECIIKTFAKRAKEKNKTKQKLHLSSIKGKSDNNKREQHHHEAAAAVAAIHIALMGSLD